MPAMKSFGASFGDNLIKAVWKGQPAMTDAKRIEE
jgi:hypothetical protein